MEDLTNNNPEVDIVNQQALDLSLSEISRDTAFLREAIDKMTSAGLKRVLKAVTHVSIGEELLTGKKSVLQGAEQRLIDRIFKMQENVIGYIQLKKEFDEKNQVTTTQVTQEEFSNGKEE